MLLAPCTEHALKNLQGKPLDQHKFNGQDQSSDPVIVIELNQELRKIVRQSTWLRQMGKEEVCIVQKKLKFFMVIERTPERYCPKEIDGDTEQKRDAISYNCFHREIYRINGLIHEMSQPINIK